MLANLPVPIWNVLTIFRPHLWGWFIGDEFGLAWMWWCHLLILLEGIFLLVHDLTGRFWLAVWSSLLAICSPMVQLWGSLAAPYAGYAVLATYFAILALKAPRTTSRALLGLLSGYFAASSVLMMYPPYAIVLAYLSAFVVAGYVKRSRRFRQESASRFLVPAVPFLLIVGSTLLFLLTSAHDAIALVQNTIYPGHRSATGGSFPAPRLMLSWFLPQAWRTQSWGTAENVCEASGFLLISPLVTLRFVREQRLKALGPLELALYLYIGLFLAWMLVGLPSFLAKPLFLDKVPPHRGIIGLGIADVLLTALLIRDLPAGRIGGDRPFVLLLVLGICWLGWRISASVVPLSPGQLIFGASALCAAAFLTWWRPSILLPYGLAVSLIVSVGFNPLARGGARFLSSNPIAKHMLEVQRADPAAIWVTMNDGVLGNLPRAIGLHSIDGANFYPQWSLWRRLDPLALFKHEYNRYAQLVFATPDRGDDLQIRAPQQDMVIIKIAPTSPAFEVLGVRYVLARGDEELIRTRFPGFRVLFKGGDKLNILEASRMPKVSSNPSASPGTELASFGATGFQDITDCETISGWAWLKKAPWVHTEVEVLDGTRVVARVTADRYRSDLHAASIGDGNYSFEIPTPPELRDGSPHSIGLRFAQSDQFLQHGPRQLVCMPGLRLAE
jgi:hypothetical protein